MRVRLDGARHLRATGASDRLCCLVANHTNAPVEAQARGLAQVLAEEFPPEDSPTADALTYADLTTGADGAPTTVEARLADIYDRYPSGHVVHESIRRAEPDLIANVRRVEARLAVARTRRASARPQRPIAVTSADRAAASRAARQVG